MNRIASILTGLSLAVLFFVASANAQSGGRMTANIPFEFTVGSVSLPAGQYDFLRSGAGGNLVLIRDVDGRTRFAVPTAPIQENALPEKSLLKFATVDGRHVLVQIWNEIAASGSEFTYGHSSVELAEPPTIQ